MKTIIAATDFSDAATNAVQYAAALAEAIEARLVLFHHFTYPVQGTDLPDIYPVIAMEEDISSSYEKRLEDIKTELARMHSIDIECVVRALTLASDLEEVFNNQQADLVVMGIHGQNAIFNALSGNETAAAIRRGNLPLLVIPQGVSFHPVQKILFPCDDHSINPDMLRPLRDLATAFDAYIEVLTLFDLEKTPDLVPNGEMSPAKSYLDTLLSGTRHGYSYENEPVVDKGILYEATRSAADLVAMIPHHHSFWSSLFNQSETQRVAATITLPLLVLGEKVQKEVDAVEATS